GGNGGPGGPGGSGGNGGGASGGPSAALFRGGDSVDTVLDSTLTHGTGGAGGDGWAAVGDGATGQAAPFLGAVGSGSADFDGDTRADTADVCPTVPGGTADANGDGCPEPPDTTITKAPANGSFALSTSTAFGFASSEGGSAFTCSLDDRAGSACTSSPTFANLAQRTHLLRVWARDPDGFPDRTPATRVWTVPLNNTALGHGRGWAKNRGFGYYLNTYSQSTKRGATLSEKVSGVRRIALVATRGRGFGTVKVYLGSKLLKKVSLGATSTRKKQLIAVASLASPRSGTVRIVVASTGKTVRVEGLGVATR
ncbi:MAG: hypothetical protein M3237_05385, partial [Actinomycetota bacterium]|nr:hypothetical protein [Actinomycetota bacterium]